jgi:hypothetical protein
MKGYKMKTYRNIPAAVLTACCFACIITGCASLENAKNIDRTKAIIGSFGTYDNMPRGKNGRLDVDRLLSELVEIHANTYNFLIWHSSTDWEDLKRFLPLARKKNILVWVTLVPPSESPPRTKRYSEPFHLDYERWAVEIAKLSKKHRNLVAWSIDDFTHNLAFYTPQRMRKILTSARQINPKLAFVPCSYYPRITGQFARDYQGLFDGILFPYRYESKKANLTDASLVEREVNSIKSKVGPSVPIIVDVYATAHSRLGDSTPEYVTDVMTAARHCADGVLVYCHQNKNKNPEKYALIKKLFHTWSTNTN